MTMYYQASSGGYVSLIPVTFIGWAPTPAHDLTGLYNAVIRLKRASHYYPAGETLHVPARCVVVKAGVRDYQTIVREASLPARTDANTLKARV